MGIFYDSTVHGGFYSENARMGSSWSGYIVDGIWNTGLISLPKLQYLFYFGSFIHSIPNFLDRGVTIPIRRAETTHRIQNQFLLLRR